MSCRFPTACLLLLALPSAIAIAANVPDPARVDEITKMLPEKPRGVGPKITDRKAWEQAAKLPEFREVIRRAENLLKEPIPELTDELFLDFSKTGNRTRCQRVLSQRHGRMPVFVLAECVENKGRFLPAIEESIAAVCSEKTWVLPAHDRSLRNFRGEANGIDLRVAGESWNMATAYYWLGEKLSPKTRKLVRDELERRTFTPFENALKTGKPGLWWLRGTNNWNAVCLAGVNGAAQAMIEDPKRRAFFIAAAEMYVQNFLRGFTPDGYCSEGVGYWNYGFGHYTMLAETVYQATDGKVDMFADPRVKKDAWFAPSMEILPGVYPAFADCTPGSQPYAPFVAFLSRRFGFGLKQFEREGLGLKIGPSERLFALGLFGWDNSAMDVALVDGKPVADSLRSWFPDAGVLICRPKPGQNGALGVAIKGGHNAEHHNHNDVGTYLVAIGKSTPLVDPGAEVYTARTFSSKRYDSIVLNSFGHPVPLVAGQMQRTGRSAAGKVLRKEFTDETDTIVFDIASAYKVKGLKKLHRTFIYSRKGLSELTVIDEVEFESPQHFGTAFITFDSDTKISGHKIYVGDVVVFVDTGGLRYRITPVEILEDVRTKQQPWRFGIDLGPRTPIAKATVTLRIAPGAVTLPP